MKASQRPGALWAWQANPHGTFVDWNPKVSCDDYTEAVAAQAGTRSGH